MSSLSLNLQSDSFFQMAPLGVQKAVEKSIQTAKIAYDNEVAQLNQNKVRPIFLVLGIITALGSVYLILAAHQVLPQGLNVLPNLGNNGFILGYGTCAVGVAAISIDSVRLYLYHKKQDDLINSWPTIQEDKKIEVLQKYIPTVLRESETFEVVHSVSHKSIFIQKSEEQEGGSAISLVQLDERIKEAEKEKRENVIFPEPIRSTLAPLINGNWFTFDKMPINNNFKDKITHEDMSGYVEKGILPDGRMAIAIRVTTVDSFADYIEKGCQQEGYEKIRYLRDRPENCKPAKGVLILSQKSIEDPNVWQCRGYPTDYPIPFLLTNKGFTSEDGKEVLDEYKADFEKVRLLLDGDEIVDRAGVKWKLATF